MIKKENADHFLVTVYEAALQEATKSTRTKTLVNKGKTIVAQEDDKEEFFLELSQLCNNNKLSLCWLEEILILWDTSSEKNKAFIHVGTW
jgi:hypothetical protein